MTWTIYFLFNIQGEILRLDIPVQNKAECTRFLNEAWKGYQRPDFVVAMGCHLPTGKA